MIQLQNLTPEVYYNKSRDFQFIGRLFDIVLNSVKTNADLLYNLPLNDNTDTRFMDLLATSLGFTTRHHYNIKQLKAVCSIFSEILRYKGTLKAVQLAGQTIINSSGSTEQFYCDIKDEQLRVFFPSDVKDLVLFNDLLTYILPLGIQCRIIRSELREIGVAQRIVMQDELSTVHLDWEIENAKNSRIVSKVDLSHKSKGFDDPYNNNIVYTGVLRPTLDISRKEENNNA